MTFDDIVELTNQLVDDLVPLPHLANDVCPACHTARDEQYPYCYSCGRVQDAIGFPCPHVIPISFYMTPADDAPPSPMRERMHDYKESDKTELRERATIEVGAIFTRYLIEHGDELRRRLGDWDAIVPVPSKRHGGPPAIVAALTPYGDYLDPVEQLLRDGPVAIGRSSPTPRGFTCHANVTGRRLLLVDDTFTTGATLHSAAATLIEAGATVAGGVVVARKINPDPRWANTMVVWERQTRSGFDFTAEPFWYIDIPPT